MRNRGRMGRCEAWDNKSSICNHHKPNGHSGGGDGGDELGDVAQSGGTVGMNDSVVLCMRASALPWFKLTELHLAMPRRTVGCHTEDSAMYAYLQLRVNGGLLRLKIGDTQQSRSIVAHGHLRYKPARPMVFVLAVP